MEGFPFIHPHCNDEEHRSSADRSIVANQKAKDVKNADCRGNSLGKVSFIDV
jgi:hypothetical protein